MLRHGRANSVVAARFGLAPLQGIDDPPVAGPSTVLRANASTGVKKQTRYPSGHSTERAYPKRKALTMEDMKKLELHPDENDSMSTRFFKSIAALLGARSKASLAVVRSKSLYEACYEQAGDLHFYRVAKMPDTFMSWFQVTTLHVWMVMARLRQEGPEGKAIIDELWNTLWEDVEHRMRVSGMEDNQIMEHSMKSMLQNFLGTSLSLDEGLVKDDMVLSGALWRNIFDKDCDATSLAKYVKYVRQETLSLDNQSSKYILGGIVQFNEFDKNGRPPQR